MPVILPTVQRWVWIGTFLMASALCVARSIVASGPTVYINQSPVFTLMATLDGLNPEQRASRIAETLSAADLRTPLAIRETPRGTWVMSGQVPVVRVTALEARLQKVNQAELADQWRRRVETALALPPLQVSNTVVTVQRGGSLLVRVIGSEAHEATFESSSPTIVTAEKAPMGVRLNGLTEGAGEVIIRSKSAMIKVRVTIQKSAILNFEPLEAEVFGTPANPETVEDAVLGAIRRDLRTEVNATIEVLSVEKTAIPSGKTVEVKVRLRVVAPGSTPFEGELPIRVRNIGTGRAREEQLWYSNNPETVKQIQPLFAASLVPRKPVRLLYHHQNETGAPLVVQVVAYNPAPSAAQVMIIRGDGQPDLDPVRTGLDAADLFLRSWLSTSGTLITIPARSRIPLGIRLLGKSEVISGLAYLSLMPGGPQSVLVRTEAVLPDTVDPTWIEASTNQVPWAVAAPVFTDTSPTDLAPSNQIFENPFRDLEANYRVGGKFTFVRIGQSPINGAGSGEKLQGNFGVLYTVNAQLMNPTPTVQNVEIAFEASAGYSGGLFVVDGEVRRLNVMQAKEEFRLKLVRLAPGERRNLKIMTMPLSGSSYPATLVMRPVGTSAMANQPPL